MIRKEYVVAENQRGLLTRDGRIIRILEPGRHAFWDFRGRLNAEIFIARGLFVSPWAEILEKRHPELAEAIFTVVRPAEGEAAVVWIDGRASYVVRPGQTIYVWKVLNEVEVTAYDVIARPRLDKAELIAFEKADAALTGSKAPIAIVSVDAGQAGLVFFDGELVETLGPGRYGYWQVGRTVTSKGLDTRPLPLEVTAQEILTKDRVSLRVTLTAFVQVSDVEKAALADRK